METKTRGKKVHAGSETRGRRPEWFERLARRDAPLADRVQAARNKLAAAREASPVAPEGPDGDELLADARASLEGDSAPELAPPGAEVPPLVPTPPEGSA